MAMLCVVSASAEDTRESASSSYGSASAGKSAESRGEVDSRYINDVLEKYRKTKTTAPTVPAVPSVVPGAVTAPRETGDYTIDVPDVIIKGLDAYPLEGPEAAVKTWIRGGPIEADSQALANAGSFKEVEAYYGRYLGYQFISAKHLTVSTKFVYLQMNYEKGPLFVRFLCYWTGSSWVVTGRFVFNTDPQQVLPAG